MNRNDELGDLSNELNQLAVILDQHETSRRQWVADTSHELKTPLAVLQAQLKPCRMASVSQRLNILRRC